MRIGRTAFAVVAASALLAGCGYRVAGRSDGLPKSIHVIAVPALVYAVGAYGFFALPYTILVYPIVFMIMPKLWGAEIGRAHV